MSITATGAEHTTGEQAEVAASPLDAPEGPAAKSVKRWVWPITAMTFVLGMFIALAMKSEKLFLARDTPASNVAGLLAAYQTLRVTESRDRLRIEELQSENSKLLDHRSSVSDLFTKQLTESQFLAGVTKVTGPGVIVILADSKKRPPANLPSQIATDLTNAYIIHDVDIQRVLNELKAGGAEALAVNDQRVVATTSVRCVGPAIQVNGVPLTPPFRISAIGDPSSLATTLQLPGGVGELLKSTDAGMLNVVQAPKLLLPAYAGYQSRFAKPVMEANGKGS